MIASKSSKSIALYSAVGENGSGNVINELSKLSDKFCVKLENKSRVELVLADGSGIAGALENGSSEEIELADGSGITGALENIVFILYIFWLILYLFSTVKVGTESTAPSAAPSAAFVIKQEMH